MLITYKRFGFLEHFRKKHELMRFICNHLEEVQNNSEFDHLQQYPDLLMMLFKRSSRKRKFSEIVESDWIYCGKVLHYCPFGELFLFTNMENFLPIFVFLKGLMKRLQLQLGWKFIEWKPHTPSRGRKFAVQKSRSWSKVKRHKIWKIFFWEFFYNEYDCKTC